MVGQRNSSLSWVWRTQGQVGTGPSVLPPWSSLGVQGKTAGTCAGRRSQARGTGLKSLSQSVPEAPDRPSDSSSTWTNKSTCCLSQCEPGLGVLPAQSALTDSILLCNGGICQAAPVPVRETGTSKAVLTHSAGKNILEMGPQSVLQKLLPFQIGRTALTTASRF